MAMPVFGSAGTFLVGATSGTAAVAVPAGVAAGNIILIALTKENTSTVSMPAGFAEITPAPTTTRNMIQTHLFWKRATAADSGTYTFTFTSTWRSATSVRIAGCAPTGTPFEQPASAARSTAGNVTPAVALTTTGPDRLLVWAGASWSDSDWTAPANFTLRTSDSTGVSTTMATRDWPTAGPTGNVTGTATGTADDQTAWLLAMLPSPPTGPESGRFLLLSA